MSIRVSVIGTGHWGKNHVRNFASLGVLGSVCDADLSRAQSMAQEYDVKAQSWGDVLADDSIGAVVVALPAELHYRFAKEALEANKHVFVEKPLALKVEDAEELCCLAKQKKKILMIGHLLQYHSAFLKLKELVSEGVLGDLQYIYSNRLNLGKIRREEDILWSFAPHDISMILGLIGQDPAQVTAFGGYYLSDSIADVTTTHLSFDSGVRAHVFVSWLHPYKEQKLVVVGSKGMAVFDDGKDWDAKLLLYPHQIEWKEGMPLPSKADAVPVALEKSEPLKDECQHFIESIENSSSPRTDGEEGVRVLKVLKQAAASMVSGKESVQ